MATFLFPIIANFGSLLSGQAANIGYVVKDSAGATKIALTTGTLTEETDSAGNAVTGLYFGSATLDTSWSFPLRIIYTISGQPGVCSEESVGAEAALHAATVLGTTVDTGTLGTITVLDALFLNFAEAVGQFGTVVRSTSSPWTITVPFLRMDGTTTGWTKITTYTDSNFTKALNSVFTPGTLPS